MLLSYAQRSSLLHAFFLTRAVDSRMQSGISVKYYNIHYVNILLYV